MFEGWLCCLLQKVQPGMEVQPFPEIGKQFVVRRVHTVMLDYSHFTFFVSSFQLYPDGGKLMLLISPLSKTNVAYILIE